MERWWTFFPTCFDDNNDRVVVATPLDNLLQRIVDEIVDFLTAFSMLMVGSCNRLNTKIITVCYESNRPEWCVVSRITLNLGRDTSNPPKSNPRRIRVTTTPITVLMSILSRYPLNCCLFYFAKSENNKRRYEVTATIHIRPWYSPRLRNSANILIDSTSNRLQTIAFPTNRGDIIQGMISRYKTWQFYILFIHSIYV